MWFIIISLTVILLAAVLGLGGGLIDFFEEHANVLDTQYIPMDLDRKTMDQLKDATKDLDHDKLEQLKKKFDAMRSKK
jgi:hypothetical protein